MKRYIDVILKEIQHHTDLILENLVNYYTFTANEEIEVRNKLKSSMMSYYTEFNHLLDIESSIEQVISALNTECKENEVELTTDTLVTKLMRALYLYEADEFNIADIEDTIMIDLEYKVID